MNVFVQGVTKKLSYVAATFFQLILEIVFVQNKLLSQPKMLYVIVQPGLAYSMLHPVPSSVNAKLSRSWYFCIVGF